MVVAEFSIHRLSYLTLENASSRDTELRILPVALGTVPPRMHLRHTEALGGGAESVVLRKAAFVTLHEEPWLPLDAELAHVVKGN